MKIYTRTGDSGSTGLFGGPRVSKDDTRIEAYGSVDELNAAVGAIRAYGVQPPIDEQLDVIQRDLFSLGAELASPEPEKHDLRLIGTQHIEKLEGWIDDHEQGLPPLKHFILPGGTQAASLTHLSRAVCRRAERRVVALAAECVSEDGHSPISDVSIVYLNRLSDYLFVLSRAINHSAGQEEVKWTRS